MHHDLWNKSEDACGLRYRTRQSTLVPGQACDKNFALSREEHYNERLCLTPGSWQIKMRFVNRDTEKEQAKSLVAMQPQSFTHFPMRLNFLFSPIHHASRNESSEAAPVATHRHIADISPPFWLSPHE